MLSFQPSKGFRINTKNVDTKTVDRNELEQNKYFTTMGNMSDYGIMSIAEKRFNKHLKHPCGCHFSEERIDFGKDSFPRYHVSKVCDHEKISKSENNCNFNSECKEHRHKVLLLKYRTNSADEDLNSDLPRGIRKDFYWDTKEVSIDCRCTFK